jgi:hypothetical protein
VVVARLDDLAALRVTGSLPQNVNYAIKAKYLRERLSGHPEIKTTPVKATGSSNAVATVRESVAIALVY